MQIIVTRPAHDALEWVSQLQAQGLNAQALPLIEIHPVCQPSTSTLAQTLAGYDALMFVSGNAVRHFFKQNMPVTQYQKALVAIKTRFWSPGPGTAQALLEAGIAATQIDSVPPEAAQYDSEHLWQRVRAQVSPGHRCLVVRGQDSQHPDTAPRAAAATATAATAATTIATTAHGQGRDWLARQLQQAGGLVDFVATYRRSAPAWSAAQRASAALAADPHSAWLFSSALAVRHLGQCLPGQNWQAAHAITTHPRITQAVRAAGFVRVCETRPALTDVLATCQALQAAASLGAPLRR